MQIASLGRKIGELKVNRRENEDTIGILMKIGETKDVQGPSQTRWLEANR